MSTRNKQIMAEALQSGRESSDPQVTAFCAGAEWADANPESGIKATFDDLQGPGIVKLSLEDGRSLSIDLSKFVNEIGKLRGAIDIETNNRLFLLDQSTQTPEEIQKSFRELCIILRKLL